MSDVRIGAAVRVGERVRDARLMSGLTQEDLSEMTELSIANIGRIERGETNPTLVSLVRISSALEMDPASFVRGLGRADLPRGEQVLKKSDVIRALRDRAV